MELIEQIEKQCEINLDWFYHSTYYNKDTYESILKDGIKCNYLLKRYWAGRFNGPYYISLAKVTIPDNITFLNYIADDTPAFILEGLNPIRCEKNEAYLKYIDTKDKRRIGNYDGEYQYYYWIKSQYIKGLVFNLYNYVTLDLYKYSRKVNIERLLEIFNLLEKLDKNIPILDYSRREDTIVHKINKEKLKYYSKQFL